MSTKYYKYMSFGPHARLSLYMLIKENALFFADKKVLNDPTDCNPNINIDVNVSEIQSFALRMVSEGDKNTYPERFIALAKHIVAAEFESRPNSENYYASAFYNRNIRRIKDGLTFEELFASEIVNYHIEEARIFSLSGTPVEPKMWAHYADSHRGICLELEIKSDSIGKHRIGDVEYTTRRPTILASEIFKVPLGSDSAAKTLLFNKMFLTKSNGWAYEQESRIYVPQSERNINSIVLPLPEGDYRRIGSVKLSKIIYGLNTEQKNIDMIEAISDRVKHDHKFAVFNIKAMANSYDLLMEPYDEIPF